MTTIDYLGAKAFGEWLSESLPEARVRAKHADERHEQGSADVLVIDGWKTAAISDYPLTVRVLSADEASHGVDQDGDSELLIVRGACEAAQLRSAVRCGTRLGKFTELARTIPGPYAHDVSGTIGVLGLAHQVLVATGTSPSVTKKLEAGALRLEAHLDDLRQLIATHHDDVTDPEERSSTWDHAIESARAWFEAAHRGVTLDLDLIIDSSEPRAAPSGASSVLRALVGSMARYGGQDESVVLRLITHHDGSSTIESSGGTQGATEAQLSALTRPPSAWTGQGGDAVPYQLRLCSLWAAQNGASFSTDVRKEALSIRLTFQPGSFSPSGRA